MSSRLSSQLRWEPVPAASVARAGLRADARPVAADAGSKPIGHDPELAPRDEAVYLLHVAAEVEHALLAQYLYAVFSLRTSGLPDDRQKLVDAWRASILQIAKEEMAHLMTVQNLLRFIGGPITLDREDYPFRSDVYPFHFRLERLTKNSLAKYVFAESRDPADYPEAAEVKRRARLSDLDNPLNHVGAIYDAIRGRFKNSDPAQAMTAADVRPDAESVGYQAVFAEWSFRTPTGPNDGLINDDNLIIRRITSVDDAVKAIDDVALQGEGAPSSTPAAAGQEPSHFERFLAIFREFPEEGDWVPTYVVPNNPNTSAQPCAYEEMEDGRITNPRARRWAQLFNHRYRMLLTDLSHTLQLGSDTDEKGRPSFRAQLRGFAFAEMGNLATLAADLVSIPQYEELPHGPVAGPPFEIPYTLDLPLLELDRWRLHRDLTAGSDLLIQQILETEPRDENGVVKEPEKAKELRRLQNGDRIRRETIIAPRIRELEAQPTSLPSGGDLSFEADIRPLFRWMDVVHMKQFKPDLNLDSFDSVKANSAEILAVLREQFMPPDAPWIEAQIASFEKWMQNPLP